MASIVFFHAHPDDEVLATGGTIAQAVDQGHNVTIVFATKGEVGEVEEGFLPNGVSLGEMREGEARKAADILGVSRIEFLGYMDSGMEKEVVEDATSQAFCNVNPDEAAKTLAVILEEVDTDILTVYDPNGGYGHPDHIQVHRVGTKASGLVAKTPKLFWSTMNREHFQRMREENAEVAAEMRSWDEEGEPQNDKQEESPVDPDTFGWPEAEITHFVDIRPYLKTKLEALLAHASQISEDSFFMKLSWETQLDMMGTEWFVLPDQDSTDTKFTSLFEG